MLDTGHSNIAEMLKLQQQLFAFEQTWERFPDTDKSTLCLKKVYLFDV